MSELPDFVKKEKKLNMSSDRDGLGHFLVVVFNNQLNQFSLFDFDDLDEAEKASIYFEDKNKNVKLYRSFINSSREAQ